MTVVEQDLPALDKYAGGGRFVWQAGADLQCSTNTKHVAIDLVPELA